MKGNKIKTKSIILIASIFFATSPYLVKPTFALEKTTIGEEQKQKQKQKQYEEQDLLYKIFEEDTKRASWWQNGFTSIFGASMVLNGAYYLIEKDHGVSEKRKNQRIDAGVNFVKSSLGFGDMLINPIQADGAKERYQAEPDPTQRLILGREILASVAAREKYERSWVSHSLAFLVNALGGVAVGVIDKRPTAGIVNFLSGMIVSEIKFFTSPQKARVAVSAGIPSTSHAETTPLKVFPMINGIVISYDL